MRHAGAVATAAIVALAPVLAAAAATITLATRPGVTQNVVLIEPPGTAVAVVVLLAGGNGFVRNPNDPRRFTNSFVIRSRDRFAAHGFRVAMPDVPSDRRDVGLLRWRDSAAHRADLAAVLQWLRARTDLPIWLIGTSRGSVSAAYAGAYLPVDGIVLTASVTQPALRDRSTTMDAPLHRIDVPVLIASHKRDGCVVTPPWDAEQLRRALGSASAAKVMMFDGGDPPRSGPCEAMSEHGFFGIEDEVVGAIADWIKARLQR